MAAINISTQIKKFWNPAATVPECVSMVPFELFISSTMVNTSRIDKITPCQKDKKITDLMVKNLMTGS